MTLYFFIDIPADVMLITSKSMLIVRLGVGFFHRNADVAGDGQVLASRLGQLMTPIVQIALVTTVLGMGKEFFSS